MHKVIIGNKRETIYNNQGIIINMIREETFDGEEPLWFCVECRIISDGLLSLKVRGQQPIEHWRHETALCSCGRASLDSYFPLTLRQRNHSNNLMLKLFYIEEERLGTLPSSKMLALRCFQEHQAAITITLHKKLWWNCRSLYHISCRLNYRFH